MRKRLLAGLFFAVLLLYNGSEARAESARSAILVEMDTGRVLYEKNAHEALPMASTTKVMTALLALEMGSLSDPVTASRNAFGVPGTSIYLSEGETLTMEEMLLGLMLQSGNDAAVAIAEHIAGDVDTFCRLMTERAEEMGCENTLFATPHGLPAQNHHTTAWDLSLITRHALQNPDFRRIVATKTASIPWAGHPYNRVLNNKNKLLSTYEGALGVKTGYTRAAGRCLVFAAERENMTVVGCVLNDPNWFQDAATIMDNGFAAYDMVTVLQENENVGLIPVENGVRETVAVYAEEALKAPMKEGALPRVETFLPSVLPAPVKKGMQVGEAVLYDEGKRITSVPLYAGESVDEVSFRFHLGRILAQWAAQ